LPFIRPPREKTMGVEREGAAWSVADLVVSHRVEVPVDQLGWAVALLWKAGGARVLAGKGDNCGVVLDTG
jgi:hypothetical protein